MSVLIDMNLSPVWVNYFNQHGIEAIHWSEILTPESIGQKVLQCLAQFDEQLKAGCMLTLDSAKARVRLLPFR